MEKREKEIKKRKLETERLKVRLVTRILLKNKDKKRKKTARGSTCSPKYICDCGNNDTYEKESVERVKFEEWYETFLC